MFTFQTTSKGSRRFVGYLTSTVAFLLAAIVFAGGGLITVDSTNVIGDPPANYRWEPSSAVAGGWMTSCMTLEQSVGNPQLDQPFAPTQKRGMLGG